MQFFFLLVAMATTVMELNSLDNFCKASPKEHPYKVSSRLAQWFRRKTCLKKLLTDDRRRTTDAWYRAITIAHSEHFVLRWANNGKFYTGGPRWPWIAYLNFWEDHIKFFFLVAFREELTRISLCPYSASSPHSLIPCLFVDRSKFEGSTQNYSKYVLTKFSGVGKNFSIFFLYWHFYTTLSSNLSESSWETTNTWKFKKKTNIFFLLYITFFNLK